MSQSVIENGPTGVIKMDDTIELVGPRVVKSTHIIFDLYESTSI